MSSVVQVCIGADSETPQGVASYTFAPLLGGRTAGKVCESGIASLPAGITNIVV